MSAMVSAARGVVGHRGRRRSAVPPSVRVLEPFVAAGVFSESEVHLTATIARLVPHSSAEVLLAVALAARGPRMGHVCVVLDHVPDTVAADTAVPDAVVIEEPQDSTPAGPLALQWPDPLAWRAALSSAQDVVADPASAAELPLRPLVWDGTRLYLQRYWSYEVAVAEALMARSGHQPGEHDPDLPAVISAALDTHFGPIPAGEGRPDAQRLAVERALTQKVSVIAGGPGTGKTTAVAKLLLAAADVAAATGAEPLRIALAAPTGKAAARMTEAVDRSGRPDSFPAASTVHRLLGWAPGTEFAHHARHPLDADLVIVDETSMVDLSLMAHLLDAVRPDAHLVLVGDPHQLASVEAGTVMGDIVAASARPGSPLAAGLTLLTRQHRFAEDSAIAHLADAVRRGDPDATISALIEGEGDPSPDGDSERVGWVRADDGAAIAALEARLAEEGARVVRCALDGDARGALDAASSLKLLAATRGGSFGLHSWTERIEVAVAGLIDDGVHSLRRGERWYVGKPVLVTANDPILGVANGDVGVVVATDRLLGADRIVAMHLAGTIRDVPPARLDRVEPWWAMTVHKSQGSEFPEVIVSLPDTSSPILTREMLYTAVTRAKRRVTILGSEDAIRSAVGRPVARASGLADRLDGSGIAPSP